MTKPVTIRQNLRKFTMSITRIFANFNKMTIALSVNLCYNMCEEQDAIWYPVWEM